MNLLEIMRTYEKEGLSTDLAAARTCQDIVLYAISKSSFNKSITIKGGIVMHSLTNEARRVTRDIDLDFIKTSINENSIRGFINQINIIEGINLKINGDIEELKHQDYHGKSVKLNIEDNYKNSIQSKIDIGVHKNLDINQEEYCFDVCLDDRGANLLKNSAEQIFVEKLRSLLIFGPASRRYKDIYDIYYLKDVVDLDKFKNVIKILIFDDDTIRENNNKDIYLRLDKTFKDEIYLNRLSASKQRWIDSDIKHIVSDILNWFAR